MSDLVSTLVILLIGFALGFAVRQTISSRRRRRYRAAR
jgi:hypothetical protein